MWIILIPLVICGLWFYISVCLSWSMKLIGFSCAWCIPSFPNGEMYKLSCKTHSMSFRSKQMYLRKVKDDDPTPDLWAKMNCNLHRFQAPKSTPDLSVDCAWIQFMQNVNDEKNWSFRLDSKNWWDQFIVLSFKEVSHKLITQTSSQIIWTFSVY